MNKIIPMISAGNIHSMALTKTGKIYIWGYNHEINNIDNTDDDVSVFKIPGNMTDVIKISSGYYHCMVLKKNGTIVEWGHSTIREKDGLLVEDQSIFNMGIPINLTDGSLKVIDISGGKFYSMALLDNGTIVEWGSNLIQVRKDILLPSNTNNIKSISCGEYHSIALKTDGTVIEWGKQIENGQKMPLNLNNVIAIAAGGFHNLALKKDGSLIGWGNNDMKQLNIPINLDNIIAIAGGRYHSVALKKDGTIVEWGKITTKKNEDINDIVEISAGDGFSIGMKKDGSVIGWGTNIRNQLDIPEELTNITNNTVDKNWTIALNEWTNIINIGYDNIQHTYKYTRDKYSNLEFTNKDKLFNNFINIVRMRDIIFNKCNELLASNNYKMNIIFQLIIIGVTLENVIYISNNIMNYMNDTNTIKDTIKSNIIEYNIIFNTCDNNDTNKYIKYICDNMNDSSLSITSYIEKSNMIDIDEMKEHIYNINKSADYIGDTAKILKTINTKFKPPLFTIQDVINNNARLNGNTNTTSASNNIINEEVRKLKVSIRPYDEKIFNKDIKGASFENYLLIEKIEEDNTNFIEEMSNSCNNIEYNHTKYYNILILLLLIIIIIFSIY